MAVKKNERYLKLINRMALIKSKGFNMIETEDSSIPDETGFVPVDFAKLRVGTKVLADPILKLGELRKINPILANK